MFANFLSFTGECFQLEDICSWYPAVGFLRTAAVVKFNFGQEPFKFDIMDYHKTRNMPEDQLPDVNDPANEFL